MASRNCNGHYKASELLQAVWVAGLEIGGLKDIGSNVSWDVYTEVFGWNLMGLTNSGVQL